MRLPLGFPWDSTTPLSTTGFVQFQWLSQRYLMLMALPGAGSSPQSSVCVTRAGLVAHGGPWWVLTPLSVCPQHLVVATVWWHRLQLLRELQLPSLPSFSYLGR